jgi:hypothetical protein
VSQEFDSLVEENKGGPDLTSDLLTLLTLPSPQAVLTSLQVCPVLSISSPPSHSLSLSLTHPLASPQADSKAIDSDTRLSYATEKFAEIRMLRHFFQVSESCFRVLLKVVFIALAPGSC